MTCIEPRESSRVDNRSCGFLFKRAWKDPRIHAGLRLAHQHPAQLGDTLGDIRQRADQHQDEHVR